MPNTIARWGNSLAVRIPKALAEQAGLADGSTVELAVTNGALVVTPKDPVYALDDLVRAISPKTRHKETATGSPRGREVW